jgi:outer membrane receptor protein involved in Fe transport
MNARYLFIVSISTGLLAGNERVHAQNTPGTVQALPPIVVSGTAPSVKRGRTQNTSRTARGLTTVLVYPTTPLAGSDIEPDKVPASINVVGADQIKQTGSLNISDALVKYVPGIIVNEVAGNPFQPDVQFRGFVASPVAGTPQGLAVYQNGVRINEAFGDTVNWDLIPTAAIQSVTLVTNNPAFGLNALGGAVNVQMKDGFSYRGAEIDTMGGSFGRVQSSAQWGKQVDNFAVYGALEGLHRRRTFGASMATSAPRTTKPNFMSIWVWPIMISAPPRRCRSNCCNNIMAPPIRRRKPQQIAWAMSI